MGKVELNRKWWAANRPKEVKGVELEKALAAVEQAKGPDRCEALEAVPDAVAKVCKGLDKKAQKDLIKALDGLCGLAKTEAAKAGAEAKAQAEAKAKSDAKAKSAEESKEKEAEAETPEEKLFDAVTIRQTIRLALRRPLLFGFGMSTKVEQCALGLSPRGNSRRLAKLAKERSGATKVCWGQLQADENDPTTLTISLECPPAGGIARMLRKFLLAQGIKTFRKFRVLVEGQEVEADVGAEEGEPAPTPETDSAAAPKPPETPAAAEAPARPPTEQELEVLEDRRRDFKKARAAWVAVKTKAEADLEKVKDGARMAYMADAQQFPKIAKGCKDIDAILDNLDDELRDTLDAYASTPLKNQAKLHQLGEQATKILDRYRTYVDQDPVLKAIDRKEFADVVIHGPISKALADLRKALS